jgi:pimeloyl-ACP methyl ester carboxylesterase
VSERWLPDPIKVEANGLTFNVLDAGAGPGVLLLHGFPDSHRLWRNQVPALLEAGFRVVAPDLRGFGESDRPEGVEAYSIGHILDDLRGILRALGLPKVHVVGHDWGSAVAWMLATAEPGKVDRLVAVSVGHPGAFARAGVAQWRRSWYILLFQFAGVAEEVLRRDDWKFLAQFARSGDIERYREDLSRPGALTAALNWYRANMPPEVMVMADPPPFPPIASPVMGVWGAFDEALGEGQMKGSEDYVTGPWRYERLEHAAHWVPLERPEELNALLLGFLSEGRREHQADTGTVRRALGGRASGGLARRLGASADDESSDS